MKNSNANIQLLREIQADGHLLILDDFGTGYSSLRYLDELPVDALKIDRSFINKLSHDPDANKVVNAILVLADQLNIGVVAEGIETAEQAEIVRDMSCGLAQGYFFAKPMPADEIPQFLIKSHCFDETGTLTDTQS